MRSNLDKLELGQVPSGQRLEVWSIVELSSWQDQPRRRRARLCGPRGQSEQFNNKLIQFIPLICYSGLGRDGIRHIATLQSFSRSTRERFSDMPSAVTSRKLPGRRFSRMCYEGTADTSVSCSQCFRRYSVRNKDTERNQCKQSRMTLALSTHPDDSDLTENSLGSIY